MKLFDHLDATVSLSGDEAMLFDSVRTLARDKIAPRAAAYDASGEFPWENVEAINGLGLNAMFVPAAYGGAELSFSAYLACVREISKACAATVTKSSSAAARRSSPMAAYRISMWYSENGRK
jgi:acyl-CoA dehydrogenase